MTNAVNLALSGGHIRPSWRKLLLGAVCLGFGAAVSAPVSALTFKTTYESNVTASPYAAQFQAAFQSAANIYSSLFVNPVTINLQVGWGSVAGSTVTSLGAAGMYGYGSYSYSQMQSMLRATSTSASDSTAYANMPTSNPAGSMNYTLTPALAKALGVAPATGTGLDGYIGFSGSSSFDFTRADGITAGSYDFMGVAMHEISHVLGRVSGLIPNATSVLPIDAFRYTAPGAPSYNYNASTYFSIDGGATNLGNFTNGSGQERDSWAFASGDSYSYAAASGVVNDLSVADKILMDVLGWNTVAGSTSPTIAPTTTTTTTTTTTSGGGGGRGRTSKRAQEEIDNSFAVASTITDVPEPASMALLGSALVCLGVVARRRRRA